jgi:aryl-alcohol dehydrogenase-like predicted oxidoreductase
VEALRTVAHSKSATVAQIAIVWVPSRGTDIVPLVGARLRDRLAEALGSLSQAWTPGDLACIEQAVPMDAVAGERYAEPLMATLDSER